MSDLKIRPIYHCLQRRIEEHICLPVAEYKIFKELERQLKKKKARISVTEALEIADYIHQVSIKLPQSDKNVKRQLSQLTNNVI